MKSFEYALKELRDAVGAETTLDKPVALVQEITNSVKGGGGDTSDPILPVMLVKALEADHWQDAQGTYYFVKIRSGSQVLRGGMANISYADLTTQIDNLVVGDDESAKFLQACFKIPNDSYPAAFEDTLKAIVNVEAESIFALWQQVAAIINECPVTTAAGDWSGDPKVEAGKFVLSEYATKRYVDVNVSNALHAATADFLDIEGSIETATEATGICPLMNDNGYQRQMLITFYDSDEQNVWLFCNPVIYKTPEMQSYQRFAEVTFQYKGASYTFRSPVYTYDAPGTTGVTWTKVTE